MRHFGNPLAPQEQTLLTAHQEDVGQEPDSFRDRSAHCEWTQAVFQLPSDSEPSTQNDILLQYCHTATEQIVFLICELGDTVQVHTKTYHCCGLLIFILNPPSTRNPEVEANGLCLSQIPSVLLLCHSQLVCLFFPDWDFRLALFQSSIHLLGCVKE